MLRAVLYRVAIAKAGLHIIIIIIIKSSCLQSTFLFDSFCSSWRPELVSIGIARIFAAGIEGSLMAIVRAASWGKKCRYGPWSHPLLIYCLIL